MKVSLFRQFSIVLRRRVLNLKRSYSMPMIMAIISIIFTIATGVISILIFNSQNDTQAVDLNFQQLDNGNTIIYYSDSETPGDFNITSQFETLSGKNVVRCSSLIEMKQKIFDKDDEYIFGANIKAISSSDFTVEVFYNQSIDGNESYQAKVAGGLSSLYLAYLNSTSELTNADEISFHYNPLNNGVDSALLWSVFGPILMSFALTVLGTQYPIILVEDRETFRLYSMQASGLATAVYYIANFIFDLVCYEIHVIIDWLILYAFGTDVITKNAFISTFIPFILSPVQTLPMVYFISLFFSTKSEASSLLLYIVLLIVLIPYFVITLVLLNDISDTSHLCVSLIPSYSVQRVLAFAATRSYGKNLTSKETITGYLGKHFIIMLCSAVLFTLLCILVDFLFKKFGTKGSKNIITPKVELDEDVKRLEEEANSGEYDNEAIVCKHVDKVYKKSNGDLFKANNDVSLYVKSRETFGVLGANGAGKSTLMSVITGRTGVSGGEILMFGNKINSTHDAQKYVSICPQFDTHLFPDMTPIEHLKMYGELKGYPPDKLSKEIEEYIQLMGLENHKNKLIRELSGGNARKLSVSLAFMGDAPIVFLDEPTASLDPVSRIQVQKLIDAKKEGRTLLLCTHLLSEAERLCNRICIMLHGQIHAIGTHQHLSGKYGKKWKVELGLCRDDEETKNKVHEFMQKSFPGCELAGQRFSSVTYNIPNDGADLTNAFLLLTRHQNTEVGYVFFTCSMSTLERVFIDLTMTEDPVD